MFSLWNGLKTIENSPNTWTTNVVIALLRCRTNIREKPTFTTSKNGRKVLFQEGEKVAISANANASTTCQLLRDACKMRQANFRQVYVTSWVGRARISISTWDGSLQFAKSPELSGVKLRLGMFASTLRWDGHSLTVRFKDTHSNVLLDMHRTWVKFLDLKPSE